MSRSLSPLELEDLEDLAAGIDFLGAVLRTLVPHPYPPATRALLADALQRLAVMHQIVQRRQAAHLSAAVRPPPSPAATDAESPGGSHESPPAA
ncbi:MAG: hypothetical protein HC914_21330 [Chloroflexaceae bacterium]|nr:hypothetical protein [Chloroflexaceae bacterium]